MSAAIVKLSSKGQLVIPAVLRKRLGLVTGQSLAIRADETGLTLAKVQTQSAEVRTLLQRTRGWAKGRHRDLVAELHARREKERRRK